MPPAAAYTTGAGLSRPFRWRFVRCRLAKWPSPAAAASPWTWTVCATLTPALRRCRWRPKPDLLGGRDPSNYIVRAPFNEELGALIQTRHRSDRGKVTPVVLRACACLTTLSGGPSQRGRRNPVVEMPNGSSRKVDLGLVGKPATHFAGPAGQSGLRPAGIPPPDRRSGPLSPARFRSGRRYRPPISNRSPSAMAILREQGVRLCHYEMAAA